MVSSPPPERRDTVDRLIDGEVIELADDHGNRLGWLISWVTTDIPRAIYDELRSTAPKLLFGDFKRLDQSLPNEVSVLLFEDGMPLAIFVPESMLDAMNRMFSESQIGNSFKREDYGRIPAMSSGNLPGWSPAPADAGFLAQHKAKH